MPVHPNLELRPPQKNAGRKVQEGFTFIIGGNVEVIQLLWKIVWWFLTKLHTVIPYDPKVILPDI